VLKVQFKLQISGSGFNFMKSASKALAKAKASKGASDPVSTSHSSSQRRSVQKFNADIPVYTSSALGSSSAGSFVIGGGGGRAKTGVKNGLHVLASPFEFAKRFGEGNTLPFINLEHLQVLSLASTSGRLYAATAESILAFCAQAGSDCKLAETCRLSLNFAKSAAVVSHYESLSSKLKDAIASGAAEDIVQLSRESVKALAEVDSQNVGFSCCCSISSPDHLSPPLPPPPLSPVLFRL
jgi:hypothetical protein